MPDLVHLLRRSWLVAWAPELPFEAVQAFAAVDPARLHAESQWPNFMIASRGGELLGMFKTEGDTLESLHVDPAHWNAGVGTSLLRSAEEVIADNYKLARLEVRSFNMRAQAFYV